MFYEKLENCPICEAANLQDGWHYDGQSCNRCGWHHGNSWTPAPEIDPMTEGG
jgi:hypothetical protein